MRLCLSYFNPLVDNPEFHSVADFAYLSPWKKVATVIVTIVASLGLGVCGVAMFRYAVSTLSDKYTEEEIAKFCNQETLIDMHSLSRYPKQRLVVDNNYCMLIDELVLLYETKNKLENPYTRTPLSPNTLSFLSSSLKATAMYQLNLASKITSETRSKLALFVKGLMNVRELHNIGLNVPTSQAALQEFHTYYQSLSEEERTALNEYHIDGYSGFVYTGLSGMDSTTFGALYDSISASCMHSVAGSFIQMLIQLDPKTEFDCSKCNTMKNIVEAFKLKNRWRQLDHNRNVVPIAET